jgi:WD40 repeat protein
VNEFLEMRLGQRPKTTTSTREPRKISTHFIKRDFLSEKNRQLIFFLAIKGSYLNGELMFTIGSYSAEQVADMTSLDKTLLAVAYESKSVENSIRLFNSDTGELFLRLIGHTADVLTLERIEEKHLASGSCDGTIKIWNWMSGQLIKNITSHTNCVNNLISVTNSSLLFSGSTNGSGTIKVLNRTSGNLIKTLFNRTNHLKTILMLNDGHLASCSEKTIRILNLTQEKTTQILSGHKHDVLTLVNINITTIASGSKDCYIKLWRVNTGKELKTLMGHTNYINTLVVISNGHLVSGSRDGSIRIWNLEKENGILVKTIMLTNGVYSLCLLLNGNLASGGASIDIWHFVPNSTNYSGY